ncbi:glycosyltransferase family 4 protein [Cyanobacteria bacterium FACHB-471]|nr:glycosyltransferase family 4 protein [Cyanobacteria bacterium FACHB-471]
MHIHLIRTRYPHWGGNSGIHQFVRYIDQNKYDIDTWVASDSDEDFPLQHSGLRDVLRHAVQMRGIQWYKLSDLTAEYKALQKCWKQQVDIVHYLDGEHSPQFLPRLLKLLGKKRPKVIATFHQPPELLDSLLDRSVIPLLDFVTVVSPAQVAYFSDLIGADKVSSILHGIDTDYFHPGDGSKEDKFKCITVGKYLRDFVALRAVAEALSDRKDIEFHVVSSNADEVKDLANVTIHQGIDDASLLKLYQQSNLLFLPLTQSTANNALLEGIACGLPVLSTDLPSVKAYLPGKEAILVQNNDPKQLTNAILELADNPVDCKVMGAEARRRARELDWKNITSQYEALYSQVMSS